MSSRILMIEDNPANLELMTYLLRAFKYQVLTAEDGEKGLALAQSERPDLVVCDIQLPKMDGFEVVRRLKLDEATRTIPTVAVTAFAMMGDRERVLAAGFDGYIGKPIVPETFVPQVEQFLRAKTDGQPVAWQPSGEAAALPRAVHAGARVLVVDNTEANRELVASTLRPAGYEVIALSNVKSALTSVRTLAPDLIISDVHMPGMDGMEFLAALKSDAALREIPFVFVSASTWNENERRDALGGGADLVLRPGEPQKLLQFVEDLLTSKGKAHAS